VVAQLVVAYLGHNLVHVFERIAFPLLGIVFLVGAVIIFNKADLGAGGHPKPGAFLIEAAAAFGYACGWNPYASDYTRYLPREVKALSVGLFAGLGVFVSCVVLESAGAAMVSAAGKAADIDPGVYTGLMPTWIGKLTLLCIAIGAVCANALNIYSGAMSALALGIRLPVHRARAIVALVFGVCGFVLALFGIKNAGQNYENFLLVIAYWIGPWLGVVLVDRVRRRGEDITRLALKSGFHNPRGAVAMGVGMVLSIWLFSNQTEYVGRLVRDHAHLGDITFLAGFAISAAVYIGLERLLPEYGAEA
jgi:purine-cytosine permease-like protein